MTASWNWVTTARSYRLNLNVHILYCPAKAQVNCQEENGDWWDILRNFRIRLLEWAGFTKLYIQERIRFAQRGQIHKKSRVIAWFRDLCNNLLDQMEIFLWGGGVTVTLCELLRHAVAQMDYWIIVLFPWHMPIIQTFLTPFRLGKD